LFSIAVALCYFGIHRLIIEKLVLDSARSSVDVRLSSWSSDLVSSCPGARTLYYYGFGKFAYELFADDKDALCIGKCGESWIEKGKLRVLEQMSTSDSFAHVFLLKAVVRSLASTAEKAESSTSAPASPVVSAASSNVARKATVVSNACIANDYKGDLIDNLKGAVANDSGLSASVIGETVIDEPEVAFKASFKESVDIVSGNAPQASSLADSSVSGLFAVETASVGGSSFGETAVVSESATTETTLDDASSSVFSRLVDYGDASASAMESFFACRSTYVLRTSVMRRRDRQARQRLRVLGKRSLRSSRASVKVQAAMGAEIFDAASSSFGSNSMEIDAFEGSGSFTGVSPMSVDSAEIANFSSENDAMEVDDSTFMDWNSAGASSSVGADKSFNASNSVGYDDASGASDSSGKEVESMNVDINSDDDMLMEVDDDYVVAAPWKGEVPAVGAGVSTVFGASISAGVAASIGAGIAASVNAGLGASIDARIGASSVAGISAGAGAGGEFVVARDEAPAADASNEYVAARLEAKTPVAVSDGGASGVLATSAATPVVSGGVAAASGENVASISPGKGKGSSAAGKSTGGVSAGDASKASPLALLEALGVSAGAVAAPRNTKVNFGAGGKASSGGGEPFGSSNAAPAAAPVAASVASTNAAYVASTGSVVAAAGSTTVGRASGAGAACSNKVAGKRERHHGKSISGVFALLDELEAEEEAGKYILFLLNINYKVLKLGFLYREKSRGENQDTSFKK
jgi:hypothetical protein